MGEAEVLALRTALGIETPPARRQGVRMTDGVDWATRPACACGCGELVRPHRTGRAWNKWVASHHHRGEKP